MNEWERNELGEPSGLILNARESSNVRDPVWRRVDVSVHDRRRGADAKCVRGLDDLFPRVGGKLPLGEKPTNLVVENLCRGTGNGAESVPLTFLEELAK